MLTLRYMNTFPPNAPINQTSGGISKHITEIIKKRQDLADKIKPVHQHLGSLLKEIVTLDNHCHRLLGSIDESEVKKNLENINFDTLKTRIEQESGELDKLIVRLSRPTLNIGVVGRMGQGKSTFLQSLSGLSDDEIPARKGGACTAVRSKIYHHDGNETKATVHFHTEKSFLEEVIEPYYRDLELGSSPTSLDAFANAPFLPAPQSATHQEMYERLLYDYRENLPHYRKLLQSDSLREITIPKADIPKYVVQQRDAQRRLITFEHLAVREVEIYCHFPKAEEVGRLGLVDVPGLGDTRLGDEKIILETLGREVDVVLFFRRPDSKRYQWEKEDFELYDLAAEALNNLEKRAFMVLNHQDSSGGGNLDACNSLRENTGNIKVVGCDIADCSKPEDANRILALVLNYLDKHIIELEEQYARSCQSRLLEIYHHIHTELNKALRALVPYVEESRQFENLFQGFFSTLSRGLVDQMFENLKKQYNSVDTDFETVVNAALQTCKNDSGIPTEAEIQDLKRLPRYKNNYEMVYLNCKFELRNHLSKNFLALDQGLQDSSNKLKRLIAEMLMKGGLEGLVNSTNGQDKELQFLEALRLMLRERQNKLELAFETLLSFNMSYGALILRLIRQDIDSIVGGVSTSKAESLGEEVAKNKSEAIGDEILAPATPHPSSPEVIAKADSLLLSDAASVRNKLEELHKQAVEKCEKTLNRWLTAPSQIRYYMAEEFVDRILYDKSVEEEWRHFLDAPDVRSKVWFEFKQIEERKRTKEDWSHAVRKVQELNQRKAIEFLF